jgi:hypothetical protein
MIGCYYTVIHWKIAPDNPLNNTVRSKLHLVGFIERQSLFNQIGQHIF